MITIFGVFILLAFLDLDFYIPFNLVFFGSWFYFILICYLGFYFFFGTFYFSFSLSLYLWNFFITHFRLFIVANLIPTPPIYFILYITMYSYVLFCYFVNIFILFNWTSFYFYNVFMFAWFIRYPIYREHCTSRELNMYWGLEMKRKTVRFARSGEVLTMVSGPPGFLPSSVEWAPIGLHLVQPSNEVS